MTAVTRLRTDHSLTPRSLNKVAQILAAAGKLFREHGYAATNMDAVACEADVSKATVYVYFSGKQDLFAAVIKSESDRRSGALLVAEGKHEGLRAALLRHGRSILTLLLSEETITSYRMVMAEAGRSPELGELYYDNGAALLLGRLEVFFQQEMRAGSMRSADPRGAAQQFVGLVRGDLMLRALLGMSASITDAERDVVVRAGADTFLRAFRPDTGASSS
jgi:AcrR family transcriptional regulator